MPVRWKAASPPFAPFVLIVQLNSQFSEHPRIQSYCYHLFSDRPVKPKQAINVEWNRPDFRRTMTTIRLQNICLKLKNVRFIIIYLLLTHFHVLSINLYCIYILYQKTRWYTLLKKYRSGMHSNNSRLLNKYIWVT